MLAKQIVTKQQARDAVRAQQIDWVNWLLGRRAPESASEIARNAGVAENTLTRILDPDYDGVTSPTNIYMICAYTGLPGPDTFRTWQGFAEDAAAFDYENSEDDTLRTIIRTMVKSFPNRSAKELLKSNLRAVGYLAGDILIIDQSVMPQTGDVVIAQVYDNISGTARTIVRTFQADGQFSFLAAPPGDPGAPAHFVDPHRAVLMGTVIAAFRPHANRASQTATGPSSAGPAPSRRPRQSRS